MRTRLPVLGFLCWPLLLMLTPLSVGCRDKGDDKVVHVFAASSLTEVFTDMEVAFEDAHPDVDIRLTFAGSQVLRLQIEQGASADVFASANPAHMDALTTSGDIVESDTFAHNALTIIVPADNPAGISSFESLTNARRLVIAHRDVPAGRYTEEVLERAGTEFSQSVRDQVVSEERNVRLVRAKVAMGEADAAVVYVTDAVGNEDIAQIAIPPQFNVRAEYRIGLVDRKPEPKSSAALWVEFVQSEAGREVLAKHGFGLQ